MICRACIGVEYSTEVPLKGLEDLSSQPAKAFLEEKALAEQ
jgi:hypothetical protein